MDAIISRGAGVAVLLEGESLTSLHADAHGELVRRSAVDVRLLLGEAENVEVLEHVSEADIARHLRIARDSEQALHLLLILLDSELSTGVREEAAAALEDFFDSYFIREEVECVLFAKELPTGIDTDVAFGCCRSAKAQLTADFLRKLIEFQPYVTVARRQWDAIPQESFADGAERHAIRSFLIRKGCFRSLVEQIARGRTADEFLVESMLQPEIEVLPNNRSILLAWTKPFRSGRLPQPFLRAEVDDREPKTHREARKHMHFSGDREEVLRKVERQKEEIVQAMQDRNLRLVRKYAEHLIEYQMDRGGPTFVSKSLCDLAIRAKEIYMCDIQLELTERSIEVKPDDGWAWSQHADALLCAGRPFEALKAYEEAHRFGEYRVAQNGRAYVLAFMNHLDDSLAEYDKAIAEHPYNVSAQNGRAEVLKSLNRLEDSLAAYDKVIAEHPYNVVAQTGRAEVLKSLNRLEASLAAYDKAIAEHPYDVVAQTGRAEVLKSLNRLDASLAAYDKVIAEHPYNVVAQTGRAEVLKSLNRLEDSLAAYDKVIAEHPYNVVAQTGRAEVLKSLNRLEASLAAYDKAIAEHPYDVVAQTGRAEVLKSLNRLEASLAAYDKVIAEHPYDVFAQNGRSCVLAAMEKWDEALESLQEREVITEADWIGLHIRGMALLGMGEIDRAISIFQEGVKNNPRPADRDYFRTALAVARLSKRQDRLALEVLEQVTSPILQTRSAVLKLHAFGRQGQCARVEEIYQMLPSEPEPVLKELLGELHRQYVCYETGREKEEWLIQKEIQYLLVAA